jgi:hypothetical protein
MIKDPSPHAVSSCPVHFIWDGRGRGRAFVRWGFLGLIATGMVWTGLSLLRVDAAATVGTAVLGASVASWLVGQALTLMTPKTVARG